MRVSVEHPVSPPAPVPPQRRFSAGAWTLLGLIGAGMAAIVLAMSFGDGPHADAVGWGNSLDDALASAAGSGKFVLVDFSATWCGPCQYMDEKVFSSALVGDAVHARFVPVRIDVSTGRGPNADLANNLKVQSLPTFLVLDQQGREISRRVGSMSETDLLNWLADPRFLPAVVRSADR